MKKVYIREVSTPVGQVVLGAMGDKLCLCDWKNSKRRGQNDNRIKRLMKVEFVEAPSDSSKSSTTIQMEASSAMLMEELAESLLVLNRAEQELKEYFAGKRKEFDVPLLMVGTVFQKLIWQALLEIPYGEVRSYMDIANRIGNPKGVRAVAQAIGSNPIAILVPCHRVVGSNGSLTGFAGGLNAKYQLLQLEKKA